MESLPSESDKPGIFHATEKPKKDNLYTGIIIGLFVGYLLCSSYYKQQPTTDNYVSTVCDCTKIIDTGDCKIVISGLISENSTIHIDTDKSVSVVNSTFYANGPTLFLNENKTEE